jgi:UDP-GlcNAc:undecaprenyl-phosphate/decaprenyl-phosphate GlcNAc-1-phosphate transferase
MINMQIIFLVSFFISVVITYALIQSQYIRKYYSYNSNLDRVQKFHTNIVPRIGGIGVFLSFYSGLWLLGDDIDISYVIWIAPLPVFIAGICEDLTGKVSPLVRIISAFLSILIAFVWMQISITYLGFKWVDYLLSNYEIISLLFTLLVVGGMVNSFNIIDGFNGILGGFSILTSLSMAYISYVLSDDLMFQLNLILCISVFGFFIFNFPFGKIFMGDGGAYLLGFMSSIFGLILVDRHTELSNWFLLLLFIYPMYEMLYSIYRRKIIHKVAATQPDVNHFHSLVYRKLLSGDRFQHNNVIRNSFVAPMMWLLSLVGIVPAVIWYDDQAILICSVFVFMFVYTIFYKYISSDRFNFNH